MSQISFSDNHIVLRVAKPSSWVFVVLYAMLIGLAIVTIGFILGMILNGIHFWYAIVFVIIGLLVWFLIRMIKWNKYGKEIFEVKDSRLHYIADYGSFKDGEQELILEETTVAKVVEHHNRKDHLIIIYNQAEERRDYKEIASVIRLKGNTTQDLYALERDLNVWLRKHFNL